MLWYKNCLKDQFQEKPGSFFYFIVPQFHLKLTNKNGKFCDQFLGSFMKPRYWHKMLKLLDSAGKKLKLLARGCAAARQFQFFPAKLTVSTFMPNHGFMKLPKNSTFCQKWSQKLPFLLSVSSETGDKKKEPGFHVKTIFFPLNFTETGLLVDFMPKTAYFLQPVSVKLWQLQIVWNCFSETDISFIWVW